MKRLEKAAITELIRSTYDKGPCHLIVVLPKQPFLQIKFINSSASRGLEMKQNISQ